jgi:hypothetical protein
MRMASPVPIQPAPLTPAISGACVDMQEACQPTPGIRATM